MIPARGRRGLSSPRPGLLGLGASGAAVPGCRSSAGTRRPSPATNGAWGCGEMSCAGRASLFWPKQFGGASRMHRCIPAPTTPPPPHGPRRRRAQGNENVVFCGRVCPASSRGVVIVVSKRKDAPLGARARHLCVEHPFLSSWCFVASGAAWRRPLCCGRSLRWRTLVGRTPSLLAQG
jgi:hypothetical protein